MQNSKKIKELHMVYRKKNMRGQSFYLALFEKSLCGTRTSPKDVGKAATPLPPLTLPPINPFSRTPLYTYFERGRQEVYLNSRLLPLLFFIVARQ